MIQRFPDDLSRQDLFAHGPELASALAMDRDDQGQRVDVWPDEVERHVATLPDPVLLTDTFRIGQLPATTRDTVFKLLESSVRVTELGAVRLAFSQDRWPGVWGPNIDTLLCCRALREAGLDGVRSAAELGSGSGFIGRFLQHHASRLRTLVLVDRHPGAAACSRENAPGAEVIAGDATLALAGRRFDLVVTNPPYIPRRHALADNAYEGVDLLAFLIQQGQPMLTPGGRIVTVTSSLCAHIVEPLLAASPWRVRTLLRKTVPLKVLNVLNNPTWLAHLRATHGLRLAERDGYAAWHEVQVLELTAP